MNLTAGSGVGYAILAIANLVLGQLAIEMGAGRVPVPAEFQWLVPLAMAALNGVAMFLRGGRADRALVVAVASPPVADPAPVVDDVADRAPG